MPLSISLPAALPSKTRRDSLGKRLRCLLLTLVFFHVWVVHSETTITVGNQVSHPGKQANIPILLESDDSLIGLQFDIRYDAESFIVASVEVGSGLDEELRVKANHLTAGHQRLVLYSIGSQSLPNREIARLNLVIDEDSEEIQTRIELRNLILAGPSTFPNELVGKTQFGTLSIVAIPNEITISGQARYYREDRIIPDGTIKIRGGIIQDHVSDDQGRYRVQFPSQTPVLLYLEKSSDTPANRGVTVRDILLLRRHLQQIQLLDSPWQLLAANVDRQSGIDQNDLALVRRLVLGLAERYVPDQPLFDLVPASIEFPDETKPWDSIRYLQLSNPTKDLAGQDFIGVKLGDLDGDWTGEVLEDPPPNQNEVRYYPPLGTGIRSTGLVLDFRKSNRRPRIDIRTGPGVQNLTSLQFTLKWNPEELIFDRFHPQGLPALSSHHFGVFPAGKGILSFAWTDPTLSGVTLAPGSPLFTVSFRPETPGIPEAPTFSDHPTPLLATEGSRATGLASRGFDSAPPLDFTSKNRRQEPGRLARFEAPPTGR